MKKWFLLLLAVMLTTALSAQTVIFHENFEFPSGADSVVSSGTVFPWSQNGRIYAQGVICDSNYVQVNDTSFLTTLSINCSGYSNVFLKFSHICKIELLDGGQIEVSTDGGLTWTQLTGTEYVNPGSSQFASNGNKFNAYTYISPNAWNYAVADAKPQSSWFMPEQFNISAIAGNQPNVKIRFLLRDGNGNGANYQHGWFLDDIQVLGSTSELTPPVITYKAPIIQDTILNTGPFDIYAGIKDASGIDTAWLTYTVNGGASNYIPMTWISDTTYKATIPSYTWNTAISYFVTASDNAPAHNSATAPVKNFYIKKGPDNVIIGTGTSEQGHPFTMLWGYGRSASIYTQSEVTKYGLIQSLAWYVSTGASTTAPIKIYLKTTTASTLSADTWANMISGATLIYDGTASFPVSGWKTFTLSVPYNYTSGNLLVLCEANYGGSGTGTYPKFAYTTATNRHEYTNVDTNPPTGSGTVNSNRPNITLGFYPVTNEFDAAMAEIVSPTAVPQANVAVPLDIRIRNNGTDTLTNVTIEYSLDGVPQPSYAWTGMLPDGVSTMPFTAGSIIVPVGAHTVKVWTSMPNGILDQYTQNDTLSKSFYACDSLLHGPYTVGPTGDFTTITQVIGQLQNCGVDGPVVFNIQSGTYTGNYTLPAIFGVSSANTITFQSESGNAADVILNYAATGSADNYVFKLDGADYIRFRNLTMQATGTSYGTVLNVGNVATNNFFEGNHFLGAVATGTSADFAVIYSSGGADSINTFNNNIIENGSSGIHWSGVGTTSLEKKTIVSNNTFINQYYRACYLYYQNAPQITGNVISTNSTYSTFYGIYAGYCDNALRVLKNKITLTNGGYGIYIYYSDGTYGNEGLTANNMISIGGTNSSYGLTQYYSSNQKAYYNSVNIYANASTARAFYYYGSSSYAGHQLKNNIFSYTGPNTSGLAEYIDTPAAISIMNNNDVYSTGLNLGSWGGTSCATLTAWKAATAKDSNSVSASPEFLSATDLHTYSFNVWNLGVPVAGVTDDFDGQPRSLTTPDLGADEFDILTYDLALLSIPSPSSSCTLTGAETVSVTFKNCGSNTLTNVDLYYTINNGTPVHEVYAGPLVTGATASYTFTTAANLSAIGDYNLKVYLSSPPDLNVTNDTVRKSLYNGFDFLLSAYTQGFEPTNYFADWSTYNSDANASWAIPYSGTTTAHTGSNSASFRNATTNAVGGDWLFTRCFPLEAGKMYEISYWYRGTASYTSKLKLKYGLNPAVASMTTLIDSLAGITNTTYQHSVKTFVPAVTGNYYFGWCAFSAANSSNHLYIDDINIRYVPTQEAALIKVMTPVSACGMSNAEPVTIRIKNTGSGIINGNLTAYYQVNGGTPVSQVVPNTIAIGDSINFTFSTTINMTAPVADSLFNIKTWVALLSDPLPGNDSMAFSVTSGYVPPSPVVTNDTVIQNYPAMLSASSSTDVYWYSSMAATTPFNTGYTYQTPALTDTATYYVSALNGFFGGKKIIGTGTSTTNSAPANGYYNYSWSSLLFTPAEIGIKGQIDSIGFYVDNSISGYTMTDQKIFMKIVPYTAFTNYDNPATAGMTNVYSGSISWSGPGWQKIKLQTPFVYDGTGSLEVSFENWDGSWTSGYPSFRYTATTATMTKYAYLDANFPAGAGTSSNNRPNMYFHANASGCLSPRVPVTAYVIYPAEDLVLVSIESPVDDCSKDNETIKVKVFNNGIDTIENTYALGYQISGNPTPVIEMVDVDILPGDTVDYTFTTLASMPVLSGDSTYTITAFGHNVGDIYFANDTIEKSVTLKYTPDPPAVVEDTVFFGTPATLQAIAPDRLNWYGVPTAGSIIDTGQYLVTPNLYTDKTYYVEATTALPSQATIVGNGTSSTYYIPFYGNYDYGWSSILFTPSELGFVGTIDTIGFYVNGATSSYQTLDQRIYMKVVPNTTFTDLNNPSTATMTSVYTGTISWSGPGWKKIRLQTPFNYDGTGSLEIAWENRDGSYSSGYPSFAYTSTTGDMTKYDYQDGSFPTGAGTATTSRPNVYFGHKTSGCSSSRVPVTAHVIIPPEDLALLDVVSPVDGCTFGTENVTVKLTNNGYDTIQNAFTLGYFVGDYPVPTVEVVTVDIAPHDTLLYTFTTPMSLNLTGDSSFQVMVYGENTNDIYFIDDTVAKMVRMAPAAADPLAVNDTVPYATAATLQGISPDHINWYNVPTGGSVIDTGAYFNTGILFGDETYWIEARANLQAGPVIIGNGTSFASTAPTYGYYNYSWSSLLFTPAELGFTGTIDTIGFYVNNAISGYNMLDQRIYMKIVPYTAFTDFNNPTTAAMTNVYTGSVSWSGPGWQKIKLQTPFEYDGTGSLEISWENMDGTYVSGYPNFRYTTTTDIMTKYDYQDSGFPTGEGTSSYNRPNIYFHNAANSCPSHRIPVSAIVTGQPDLDAGVTAIVAPVSTISLGAHNVDVIIRNYGLDTLETAMIGYSVNGIAQTPFTWTGSLLTGQTDTVTVGAHNFTYVPYPGNNDLVAWIYAPNGGADTMPINDTATASVIAHSPYNGTYYLGTATNPDFPDFTTAAIALKSWGVSGPVNIMVESGTYTEQVVFDTIPGAGATKPITFNSITGNNADVKLVFAGISSNNYVLKLNNADYFTFKNMTIKNTASATYGRVVELSGGATHNTFQGNVLQSIPTTSSSAAVVYMPSGADHYNRFIGNDILNGYYGIYCYGSSSVRKQGNHFINNNVNGYYYYGVYAYYNDSVRIIGNRIVNASNTTTNYPVYASYTDNGSRIERNNIVSNSTGSYYGIYAYYNNSGSATIPNVIANNMVSQQGGTGTAYGLYLYYSNYLNVYFNSVNINGGSTTDGRALYLTGGSSNINIVNNNLVNTNGGYAFYISSIAPVNTSNYNNLYTNGSTLAYWSGSRIDLASLKAASGKDLNSVSVNPSFSSVVDLHCASIDLYHTGTPVAGITTDIDLETRNATAPCIGADEFMPPHVDAGVIEITDPLSPVTGTQNVIVTIRNFGLDTLTSAMIHWDVDGVQGTPHLWTGSLPSGAVLGGIVIGAQSFPTGASTIRAWTELPNNTTDPVHANDTAETVVLACNGALAGTYTIGGVTSDFVNFTEANLALQYCGVSAPVVFNVQPGIYNEQLLISTILGASAVNTITFQSATGINTDVTLRYGANTSANNYVLKLDSASYFRFKNLTLESTTTNSYGRVVVLSRGSSNNQFEKNIIRSVTSTSSSTAGIYSDGGAAQHHNIFDGNRILNGYYGIYYYGTTSVSGYDNKYINNEVTGYYYGGIYIYYSDTVTVINNHVVNGSNSTTNYPISLAYCDKGAQVLLNRIDGTSTGSFYGLRIYYCDGTQTEPTLVANNFVSSANGTGTAYGLYIYYSNFANIIYNSVNIASGSATGGRALYTSNGSEITLLNNNLVNSASGYAYYVGTTGAIVESDYNNIWAASTILGYWSAAQADLTALQTASSMDTNSISMDPVFISTSDLHVLNPGLNAKATPIAGITEDIDGETRNATTPDIGADEFVPLPKDLSVVDFVLPSNMFAPVGTNVNVTVKVRNMGSDTITSFNLAYKYAVASPVTTSWTGTLAPGTTTDVAFGPAFHPVSGLQSLCAYTLLSGDGNIHNDTLCTSFTGVPVLVVPDSTDFESGTNWYTEGTTGLWEFGVPASDSINAAHSPTHAWKTNLDGEYGDSQTDYLYTAYFDFTQVEEATLKFWHRYITESGYDGGKIEYNISGTSTWVTLGYVGDPAGTNWYTASVSGNACWEGSSHGWILSSYKLSNIPSIVNATGPVQFRFKFFSDPSGTFDGWAIDDFAITAPPLAKDAGVVAVVDPAVSTVTGSNVTLKVSIKNFGADSLMYVPVAYRINGGAVTQSAWTGILLPGDTTDYTFPTTFVSPASTYQICAFTKRQGDTYKFNDTTCVSINATPAPFDAGISALLSPTATTTAGDSIPVIIRIRNYGTVPLTSIPVGYSRNGVQLASATWTGNLAAGDSVDYTFVKKYVSPMSFYSLCAYSMLGGDANNANDQHCVYPEGVIGIEEYGAGGFMLWQNVPNPATGRTSIAYQVPGSGNVTFELRNLYGQLLMTEQQNVPAGQYTFEIDVDALSVGIYYYSVTYDNKRLTKKMIVH